MAAGTDAAPAPPAAPTPPRRLLALPAVLLVLLGVWEAIAIRRSTTAVPDDAAWTAAAAVVRAEHRPGDLIVFAPAWVDPVGRLHLGDLIPIDMAARMDADRYGRIWELSIRGAHHADTAGLRPVATAERGGVTVRRFERTPVTVRADVRDLVASARVEGGGRPALVLAEVGFQPHRCLEIVPRPGTPARITFPALPLGRELVGYVGIADVFTRRDERSPGQLDVEISGRVVATARPGVDDGWVRFAAPTTPGAADVTFVARATGPNKRICFAAEARQ